MSEPASDARPRLLVYTARYPYAHKNAVAATLAWVAESRGSAFEVYYDAEHAGVHYGGGGLYDGLSVLTGAPISGGRHLETLALALQRFKTTVVSSGSVAFANTLAALAPPSGAKLYDVDEGNVVHLYETVFSSLGLAWPKTAVMVNATPSPHLDGLDAYCYPEIFYRQVVGIESSAQAVELGSLHGHGIREILTCGISEDRMDSLRGLGFEVRDLGVVRDGDDFASITSRLAQRWRDQRKGWMVGDPVMVAYWLPTACRERRAAIYSDPQSHVIDMLREDIAADTLPVLGRQHEDADFFTLSELGQSLQVIDPCRPPLPVLQTLPSRWSSTIADPHLADPTDQELEEYARQGRVLVSLVFWTGMIREVENLYALMDLFALTGLRAGIVLTSQSMRWRPSPLDLLTVPREQGGVFPNVEVLLGSCGEGVAIESLLSPQRLRIHLEQARRELEQLDLPRPLWPEGWWSTMDAPMLPRSGRSSIPPVRWRASPPYVQLRYYPSRNPHMALQTRDPVVTEPVYRQPVPASASEIKQIVTERVRRVVRKAGLKQFFEPYRPYEHFAPGPIIPELADAVQDAGLSYMLTKSGFGERPKIMYRNGDFLALNYTAGQWDGWTPFETINDVGDLRRAEKSLLSTERPGWLLGGIDTCLWAFSGELWERAPGLAAIARYAASGGSSGKLINVAPRVLARYARVIDRQT